MHPAIQELLTLVPPPEQANNAKGDWNKVEADLGLVLPDDYKQYIEHYGQGTLCAFFSIPSPFNCADPFTNKPLSAREAVISFAEIYHGWGERGIEVPFPVYPSTPGLFPWGQYGDVDVLSWHTLGEPSSWYTVYLDREFGFFELKGMGFGQFLVAALKGMVPLPEKVFGKHLLDEPRAFESY